MRSLRITQKVGDGHISIAQVLSVKRGLAITKLKQ
jgi:hypothetical protein